MNLRSSISLAILMFSAITTATLPLFPQGQERQEQELIVSQKLLDGHIELAKFNGALFFYDEEDGRIAKAIESAASQNPQIYDRLHYPVGPSGTPKHIFGSSPTNPGHMPASAIKHGWEFEPRWWVVNKNGHTASSSTTTPTEAEILRQLDDAGVQEFSQILKNYITKNPFRIDVPRYLMWHQYNIARIRLKKHLIDNGWDKVPYPPPELQKPLTDSEDDEVWGDFAEAFRQVIKSGTLTTLYLSSYDSLRQTPSYLTAGTLMAFSPRVKALATQILPRMTELVRELPQSQSVWSDWLILERASGGSGSALAPLVASIQYPPWVNTDNPPERVMQRLLEDGDNIFIAEQYFKKMFESEISSPIYSHGAGYGEWARKANTWRQANTLLDVYLRQNIDSEADSALITFINWAEGNCKEELEKAIQLAKNNNRQRLAEQWSRIDLEEVKRNTVRDAEPKSNTNNISWIVINSDDGNDISDAFNREINSYRLDSLLIPVKVEKPENAPHFTNLKPGWGLYDGNRILNYTVEQPSYDLISAMAKRIGIVSKIEEMENFRKVNDRSANLEMELLIEYLRLANRRMNRFNQAHTDTDTDKPMLSEEDDKIIWKPIAEIIESLFSNNRYKPLGAQHDRFPSIPDSAIQSPLMRNMADRMIHPLREWIRQEPSYDHHFHFFHSLNKLAKNKYRMLDIFSDLTPTPRSKLILYHSVTIGILNRDAQELGEWDIIIDLGIPHWEYWLSRWPPTPSGEVRRPQGATIQILKDLLGPLIDALLARNEIGEADRIFTEFMEKAPSADIQKELVEIAIKRNKPELARRWGAI